MWSRGIICTLMAVWMVSTPAIADAARPNVLQIARYFDTIVFGGEYGNHSSILKRWEQPVIGISLQGRMRTEHASWLSSHLNTVTRLSGIRFRQVKTGDKGEDISYIFVKRSEMGNIKGKGIDPHVVRALASAGGCYFMAFSGTDGIYKRGIIVVNIERPDDHVNSCLLEETMQMMGLPNDSDNLRPSIFSDSDHLLDPSFADKVLMRTLYDKRLSAGLNRDSANARAAMIIQEILRN